MTNDELLAENLRELIASNAARAREHQELLHRVEDLSTLVLSMLEQLRTLGFMQQPDFRGYEHLS